MCGIFALLYQNMDIFDVSLNNSFMLGKKRGPEFSTFTKINDTTILFGFHRLAINGLDTISNQIFDENNYAMPKFQKPWNSDSSQQTQSQQ